MVAHDTRSSALDLCKAAAAGISAVGGTPEPALLLTTPQLHWMVARRNCCLPFSEVDYFQTLLGAFEQLRSSHCPSAKAQVGSEANERSLCSVTCHIPPPLLSSFCPCRGSR